MGIFEFKLRPASRADAEMVAWTVLTALDLPLDDLKRVKASCADEKSMYSWANTIVACHGDEVIGCIVSYPGDKYESMRQYTWPRLWADGDNDDYSDIPAETQPGEYYLDSMAIKPQYRGYGIGRELIRAAMQHGENRGYDRFGLLVSVHKPKLMAYYETMGFKAEDSMMFFGHPYHIMRQEIKSQRLGAR